MQWRLFAIDHLPSCHKKCFTSCDFVKEIYMDQPLGFVAQGESSLECKLCHSLYGWKESTWAWFSMFNHTTKVLRLKWSDANHSVFYCHTSLGKSVYLIIYVNDIVITENDTTRIFQLKEHFLVIFTLKILVIWNTF